MEPSFETDFAKALATLDRFPASKTRRSILEILNNNDDDLIQPDKFKVSLICPLSKMRIETPVRYLRFL